ncbi:MAG: RluA family pseudouridine synthase [Planctomycetaceae bacterium]|nr:RluA family pseudouridine synthase [Planctomycetaceae bacterium]
MNPDALQLIDANHEGQTVLAVLRSLLPGASWNDCRRQLSARRVLVNGVLCIHEARRLQRGDEVRLLADPVTSALKPAQLVIHYVDEHIVVVDKPIGVVSTRRPEEQHWPAEKKRLAPTLDELVAARLRAIPVVAVKPRKPIALPPLLRVQRLDRETTGIIVFARTTPAAAVLIDQFAEHRAERVYYAVVPGCPPVTTIRSHLVRDRGDGHRGSSPDGKHGVPAVTHVRPLETRGGFTKVECRLETGRTHQIRIHLSELGFPVCGDREYGATEPSRNEPPRLALHAAFLAFIHPATQQRMEFNSPWPEDLNEWWQNAVVAS